MKSTIVITGGGGFVGQWLQEELRREEPDWQLDIWDSAASEPVDITQPATYRERLEKLQPAWVIHLAAVSSVLQAYKDPGLTQRVNVDATKVLLQEMERLSPESRMLAVSTSDIYGQGSTSPLPELPLDQVKPRNPYAQSKWDMERMIEDQFRDRVVRVRPFPHIGPRQGLGFVSADFASQIAAAEKTGSEAVMRVGNLEAVRDFTDVRDVVRAYRLLLHQGELGEVYHIASGTGIPVKDLLQGLLTLSSVPIRVEEDSARMRPSDIPSLIGSAAKLTAATGWMPEVSLPQTLRDILDYWRSR